MTDEQDSWWEFVEWYYNESEYQTVPLSYILLPQPDIPSVRTPGSPSGALKLNRREYNNLMKKGEV